MYKIHIKTIVIIWKPTECKEDMGILRFLQEEEIYI